MVTNKHLATKRTKEIVQLTINPCPLKYLSGYQKSEFMFSFNTDSKTAAASNTVLHAPLKNGTASLSFHCCFDR